LTNFHSLSIKFKFGEQLGRNRNVIPNSFASASTSMQCWCRALFSTTTIGRPAYCAESVLSMSRTSRYFSSSLSGWLEPIDITRPTPPSLNMFMAARTVSGVWDTSRAISDACNPEL
jgi:hypothetical protein